MKQVWTRGWMLLGLMIGGGFAIAPLASAQITPDGTLPIPSSVDPGCLICTIEGGTAQGSNLFHSFSEFSIPAGGEAFFNNSPQIENIFSRVTGSSISEINGLIRANGTANLFTLNPNGIIFGPDAQLDIGGTFLASTADAFLLSDQGFYSATIPTASQLLTIGVPIGLQYGAQPTGDILHMGTLAVEPSQSLVLVGGNITLDGGQLLTPGGRVELGGLTSAGIIELTTQEEAIRLNFSEQISRGNVSLINDGRVNVRVDGTTDGGGDILVYGQDISIEGGGTGLVTGLSAGFTPSSSTLSAQAGDIEINATSTVSIAGGRVFNNVLQNAVGDGGDINIVANIVSIVEGGQVDAISFGQGNTGKISIDAREDVFISGVGADSTGFPFPSGISSVVQQGGEGKSGGVDILVREGSLRMTDGATNNATVAGTGTAGDINLRARDSVVFDGVHVSGFPTALNSVVGAGATGTGGNITVAARTVSILNGAELAVTTGGIGDAGTISIEARDSVILKGPNPAIPAAKGDGYILGGIFAEVSRVLFPPNAPPAQGRGGDISIRTNTLEILDGSIIQASTFDEGDAGDITVQVDKLRVQGRSSSGLQSGIFSTVQLGGKGEGGEISIDVDSLETLEGGLISTAVLGQGNAGDIRLFVSDRMRLAGEESGLFANADETADGQGGNIIVDPNIVPHEILIQEGARIAASNQGQGEGGVIQLAANALSLENNAQILAETASNTGGDVTLDLGEVLLLRNDSRISTTAGTAQSGGDGGSITIDIAEGFVVAVPEENSDITANSFEGRGGNIEIFTQALFGIAPQAELTPLSDITASSEFGVNGTIQVNNLELDPNQGLTELPSALLDESQLLAQGCQQPTADSASQGEFFNSGRGGIGPLSSQVLGSDHVLDDLRLPAAWRENESITEAQGWSLSDSGNVVLTALPESEQVGCWR